jgi:hypothetical protein
MGSKRSPARHTARQRAARRLVEVLDMMYQAHAAMLLVALGRTVTPEVNHELGLLLGEEVKPGVRIAGRRQAIATLRQQLRELGTFQTHFSRIARGEP